jgi:hypothetical protein
LLERTLLSARNLGIKTLQMNWLVDDKRMQHLARKYGADLKFDFDRVIVEFEPPRHTPFSLLREAAADVRGVATAVRYGGRLPAVFMFFLTWFA